MDPAAVGDRPFHEFNGLLRRVEVVRDRFANIPNIPLIPCPAPVVVTILRPAIKDRLVLALVV